MKNTFAKSIYQFKSLIFPLLFLLVISLDSCRKEAGEGGTGSLIGEVYIQDYNKEDSLIRTYLAADERVYVIYGDSPVYDDDVKTSFNGTYQFKHLNRGFYTIFAYSDCVPDTCDSGQMAVFQTVKIRSRGEEKRVPDIYIKD